MKYLALSALLFATPALAGLEVQQVTDDTYALVGPMEQRNPENFANNATFGVIVTKDGVVLVDAGGSWLGAEEIDNTIATITDQPVKVVINTGGQDHRWMGNSYWLAKGARVIASEDAVADQKDRESEEMSALAAMLHDSFKGTEAATATTTFDTELAFNFGGVDIDIRHLGAAHTPGNSIVWLPAEGVVFTGDLVYVERILGVGPQSNSASWIDVFEKMARLNPEHIIPGHGHATTLAEATKDTYDYLVNLRQKMGEYMAVSDDIINSVHIDQSAFAYLKNFDQLAGKNAQQVFTEMEWE